MVYLVTAFVLLVYLAFAWLLGSWMHLAGASLWILRGGLALLGLAAAALFLWFRRSRQPASATPPAAPGAASELDLLMRAAEAKLASAKLPHAVSLNTLPVTVVMGLPGSAKTSVITNSGLDPELLAGAVLQDGAIIPTPTVNVWYGAETVFIEPAGKTLLDPKCWAAVLRRIAPSGLRSVFRGGPQPPRIALVCFDAETLAGSAADSTAQALVLRERLAEMARTLGVQVPVYVLFTRMDRLPFFTDYVSTFSREEADRVLGSTLPLARPSAGLYADEQTARLGRSFDGLFRSTAGARIEFLSRQTDPLKAGRAYEFPREFHKLRPAISNFLLELCRPSQFAVGPVLRGYYFTGVRPVTVENLSSAAAPVHARAERAAAGATVLFRSAVDVEAEPTPVQPRRVARRVPQWVFLPQLFHRVILRDHGSRSVGISVHTNMVRHALLAGAALFSLLFAAALTISWARNTALESRALAAARALAVDPAASGDPSREALERLDNVRDSIETLDQYRRGGAPLSYRWGLYQGNGLYPELRRVYFDRFHRLLFGDTQTKLVNALRSVPAKPGSDYGQVYDTLKAYLMTTSNHDRSTRAFLAPVLLDRWSLGRVVDAGRMALSARQFAFYADQLKEENPYASAADVSAVADARDYLSQFAGVERIYRAMLAEAARSNPPIDFDHRFPGASAAVVDPYQVSGAFTKGGWQFMSGAMRDPDRYFSGEAWVLGTPQTARLERAHLEDELRARYSADYLNTWRTYLKSASVVRYANLSDAARKLNLLAGNQSPLLAVLALASENVGIGEPALSEAFQPVAAVEPPAHPQGLIGPPNQPYMSALLALGSAVEQASAQPDNTVDAAAGMVLSSAGNAKIVARQLAQSFKPDTSGHVDAIVEKLLEDPITQVEGMLRVLGPQELNGK